MPKYNPTIICACGCHEKFLKFDKYGRSRKYLVGHQGRKYNREYKDIRIKVISLCACGCKAEFEKFDSHGRPRKYIQGHQQKNKSMSEGTKKKIGDANKGNPTWCKGMGLSDKYIQNDNSAFRRLAMDIKIKRNWMCNKCGKIVLNGNRMIHVHHKDGNVFNNHDGNLEVLCAQCNISYHKKEQYLKYKGVHHSSI